MERRPYRRRAEGSAARRRYRRSPCRARKRSRQSGEEARMTDVHKIYPRDRVVLREVGLRDGLQLVKTFPSTDAKRRWVRDEYAAGVRCFEVGSFLPAKTFPQFVDVRDVVSMVGSLPGAHGIALVL